MSRSLRKIGRKQEALKAFSELSRAIPKLQGSIKGIVEALPKEGQPSDTEKLVSALIEDAEALSVEQEVQRETFIRLLIALSEDSEENIRKVEAEVRAAVLKERT